MCNNASNICPDVLTSLLAEVKQGDGTSLPDGQQHIKMIQANGMLGISCQIRLW